MTITYALQNLSSETAESVNIKPFDRSGFSQMETDLRPNELYATEYRSAGDVPEYPLIQRVSVKNVNKVFHPDAPNGAMNGKLFQVATFSHVRRENDVSGDVLDYPIIVETRIIMGGGVILDAADVLDFVLTHNSALYPSVSSGTPATGNISLLAIGGTKLY
jgi:hypothetical protein